MRYHVAIILTLIGVSFASSCALAQTSVKPSRDSIRDLTERRTAPSPPPSSVTTQPSADRVMQSPQVPVRIDTGSEHSNNVASNSDRGLLLTALVLIPTIVFVWIVMTVMALHRREVYFWSLGLTWISAIVCPIATVLMSFSTWSQLHDSNAAPFRARGRTTT